MINETKNPPKRLKSCFSMILNYHFAPAFLRFSYTYTIQNYTLHGLSVLFIILIIKYLYRFPEVSKTITAHTGKTAHLNHWNAPSPCTRPVEQRHGFYICLYFALLCFLLIISHNGRKNAFLSKKKRLFSIFGRFFVAKMVYK